MTQVNVHKREAEDFDKIKVGEWIWYDELPSGSTQCVKTLGRKITETELIPLTGPKTIPRAVQSNLKVIRIGIVDIQTSN